MIAASKAESAVILAPMGRDAGVATAVLGEAGIPAVAVNDVSGLVAQLNKAAFAVVTEEALNQGDLRQLRDWLESQPDWSDFPFILLTSRGGNLERNPVAARHLGMLGNVTFIERPFHPTTLVSLAKAAVRARFRQYDARARLETIRSGEQRIRDALTAGRLGAWSLDLSTRELNASPRCKAHHGRRAEEPFTLQDLFGSIDLVDLPQVRSGLDPAHDRAGECDIEYRCIWPDGQRHWVHMRGHTDGALAATAATMSGVTSRITDRKRSEDALRRSEERFRAAVAAVGGVLWTNTSSGEMHGEQLGWAGLTGQLFEAYQGFGWADAVHPDDAQPTIDAWKLAVDNRAPFVFEHRVRMHGGEWGIFAVRAVPALDTDGQIREWVGVHTDISQQRAAERALIAEREGVRKLAQQLSELNVALESRVAERTRALRDTNRRLEKEIANREVAQAAAAQSQKLEALGQLTAGVAHDFNNILAALFAVMRLIEKRTDNPAILDFVKHGVNAGERGKAIVSQLLAFARQRPMAVTSLDMNTVCADLAALIGQAVGAHVRVDVQCPEDVWPGLADISQLQVAVLNLAVNARDAMPDGGVLSIGVANAPAGTEGHPAELRDRDAVRITVRDTGFGIPAEVLERVVEPFFTTKAAGKGTGLGLAMVHGFAIQSKGALRIASRVGEGTTITLYIPRGQPEDAGDIEAPAVVAHAMMAGETLLLVDDDDTLRFVTAAELRDTGCSVIDADGAEQALDIVARSIIDAAILDVMMPGVDGPTLARRLRALRPDLPIMFMTARPDYPGLEGERVIVKPASARDIIGGVCLMLEARDNLAAAALRHDRLAERLKSECTRSLFAHWRTFAKIDPVPAFETLDLGSCRELQRLSIVTVDATKVPIEFHIAALGDSSRPPLPEDAMRFVVSGSDQLGAREAAYRRCQRTGRPSYEFARVGTGQGPAATFERLLLPYTTNGSSVTHIVSAVAFEDEPATSPS